MTEPETVTPDVAELCNDALRKKFRAVCDEIERLETLRAENTDRVGTADKLIEAYMDRAMLEAMAERVGVTL